MVASVTMLAMSSTLALGELQPRTVRLAARQLFMDTADLATVSPNASVRLHRPVVHGPPEPFVLEPEEVWEGGRFNYYHSVVDNGTHVLLYYDSLTSDGPVKNDIQRVTCLAISSDGGNTFMRPDLGLVAFNGSRHNNIVWPLNKTSHSPGTVFMDPNPNVPADERYKMIAIWNPDTDMKEDDSGSWTMVSADGIRFRPKSHGPVYHGSDTQDVALWDESLEKYVAFRRLHQPSTRVCSRCAGYLRPNGTAPPHKLSNTTTCSYECPGSSCTGCPDSSPFYCKTHTDCPSSSTCQGKPTKCVSGVCSSGGAGGMLCNEEHHENPSHCGQGDAAERHVGRCVSDTFDEFPGCDEGLPENETQYTTVFGPDAQDDPCVDLYTNQVTMYEGHYIAFPAAFEHLPSPPAWIMDNDGTFDTRMLHSRDGQAWSYVGGDRAAWLPRGPAAGPPTFSAVDVPGATDPTCWRESMTAAVRGVVVQEGTIVMYGWGCRCRHGQDTSTVQHGGGGAIAKLSLRRDGFGSIGTHAMASWNTVARLVTKSLVVQLPASHSALGALRLVLNIEASNGGNVAVGLRRSSPGSNPEGLPIPGFSVNESIPLAGNYLDGVVAWLSSGANISAVLSGAEPIQVEFVIRGAVRLYSYRFESY